MTEKHTPPAAARVVLAGTMGDAAGIGPEIWLEALTGAAAPAGVTPILIGDGAALRAAGSGEAPPFAPLPLDAEASAVTPGAAHFIDLGGNAGPIERGAAGAAAGRLSLRFLEGALELARRGLVEGIVTAPISKEAWRLAGARFPGGGHTEFLRGACGVERTEMVFMGGGFRVALFTTHVSLRDCLEALEREALASFISFVVGELGRFGMTGLRVAVAGLNPHAGEGGMFGDEELRAIAPAVADCRRRGIDIRGPLPADTLFTPQARRSYDLVVAIYHDQGLIPVKTVAPYGAVNVTLGLPFVRTSPAHGVAFDIAGRGTAVADGLVAAIETAADLVARRRAVEAG